MPEHFRYAPLGNDTTIDLWTTWPVPRTTPPKP